MPEQQNKVWTIGHSTRAAEEFIALLKENDITTLVDVRHFPGSRKFPHFNKDELSGLVTKNGMNYTHMVDLGGRRKPLPNSINTGWRHEAFRGYADYMQSVQFLKAVEELMQIAVNNKTAYMCSEAVWWRCHRGLISDYLKIRGWEIMHIMSQGKAVEHPYTSAARIVNGELRYDEDDLFS